MMRTLWRFLLNGRVKVTSRSFDLYRWRKNFEQEGFSTNVRLALREALKPCIVIREPFRWPKEGDENNEGNLPQRIQDLVEWELELATDHVSSALRDLPMDGRWNQALPEFLFDFTLLLRDAMDLRRELGDANDRMDHSYVHRPSISDHPQNKDFHEWTELIELTKNSWLAMAARSPLQARNIAESWMFTPYPVFHRLAFFAAAQPEIIPERTALDWLLSEGNWWLWSVETQREAMRLLVAMANRLSTEMLGELENAILIGPPREMFNSSIESQDWNHLVAHSVWLHLEKLSQSGAILSDEAEQRRIALSTENPEWKFEKNEKEEFPFWMESARWVDTHSWQPFTPLPSSRHGILSYLREYPELKEGQQDDWKKRCRDSFLETAYALRKLARQGVWPSERWKDALQVWSDEDFRDCSWRFLIPVLSTAPDSLLMQEDHSLSWWLQEVAKTFQGNDAQFLELARRILQLSEGNDGAVDDPVFHAINHPIGHITEALLRWWYRQSLEDGQGLNDDLSSLFSEICDTQVGKFRHGRVLLATHLVTLFRVDSAWCEQHLIPLFDWRKSEVEARSAWEGFLRSPRLYRPLIEVIKPAFLETANHYTQLGDNGKQYASILTFAALDPGDTFNRTELAHAMRALPAEGLREAASALVRAQEGAGDQREDHWKNRVLPFWEKIWPKSKDAAFSETASSLARLCVSTGDDFPKAVAAIGDWLQPIEHPDFIIQELHKSDLAERFPEAALRFLDSILRSRPPWIPQELRGCLNAILRLKPDLRQEPSFMRLDQYAREHGQ